MYDIAYTLFLVAVGFLATLGAFAILILVVAYVQAHRETRYLQARRRP